MMYVIEYYDYAHRRIQEHPLEEEYRAYSDEAPHEDLVHHGCESEY